MSCSCTRPPEPGRCAAGASPRAAGAHVPPMRLTPSLPGQGPRIDRRGAGAAALGPEIRVASAAAARGRTGNVTALNFHLLFLLRGRRLPARFPDEGARSIMSKCHAHGAGRIS